MLILSGSFLRQATNYQSSLLETRIAGDRGQVSEVTQQGDMKFLYKLRVDSLTLRRRNVNARPTDYMRKMMSERRAEEGKATIAPSIDTTTAAPGPVFQSEFENEKRRLGGPYLFTSTGCTGKCVAAIKAFKLPMEV